MDGGFGSYSVGSVDGPTPIQRANNRALHCEWWVLWRQDRWVVDDYRTNFERRTARITGGINQVDRNKIDPTV